MNRVLEDFPIIQSFVRGEITPLLNSNLRLEANSDISQLISRNGQLLALIKLVDKIRCAWVKQHSEYWELLNQILQQNSFVPLGKAEKPGLMAYEQHEIPVGYKMQYTSALNLWKAWFPRQQQFHQFGIPVDIFIFLQKQWQDIREIILHEGNIFVKLFCGEKFLHGEEKIVWISKSHQLIVDQTSGLGKNLQKKTEYANNSKRLANSRHNNKIAEPPTELLTNRTEYQLPKINQGLEAPINLNNVLEFSPGWEVYSPSVPSSNSNNLAPEDFVVKFSQGRLYINTEIGQIIVEGSDYRFHINPRK